MHQHVLAIGDCATWVFDDFFTQSSMVAMKIIHPVWEDKF